MQNRLKSHCCAQFFVHKTRILKISKIAYIKWRDFILHTYEADFISSRIFEYAWPIIFGGGWDESIPLSSIVSGYNDANTKVDWIADNINESTAAELQQ